MLDLHLSCMAALLVLAIQPCVCCREPSPDYYPDTFSKYSDADWPAIRETLGQRLLDRGAQDSSQAYADVFLLRRIRAIKWKPEQKGEVVAWLEKYFPEALQKDIPHLEKSLNQSNGDQPIPSLALEALRTLFVLDVASACTSVEATWPRLANPKLMEPLAYLRSAVLVQLRLNWRGDGVAKCLRFICQAGVDKLDESERAIVQQIESRLALRTAATQGDAWEVLWERQPLQKLDSAMTWAESHRWRGNAEGFMEVFEEPSAAAVLKIARSAQADAKKYVLFYATGYLLNAKLGLLEAKDAAQKLSREKLEEITSFLATAGEFHTRSVKPVAQNSEVDYLGMVLKSLSSRLEKAKEILNSQKAVQR